MYRLLFTVTNDLSRNVTRYFDSKCTKPSYYSLLRYVLSKTKVIGNEKQ